MTTEEATEDSTEITGPQFGVSEQAALALRWSGHVLLGVMVCLLVVWLILKPAHAVMLFATIVISTVGVMCEILGWVSGLAGWLLRCLRRILQHFESERVRRGEALFGAIALIHEEVRTSHKEAEVDRGRVVAIVEQVSARLDSIEERQRIILEELRKARTEPANGVKPANGLPKYDSAGWLVINQRMCQMEERLEVLTNPKVLELEAFRDLKLLGERLNGGDHT